MSEAILGLGSNLGARCALLRAAIARLAALPGCAVRDTSPLYLTPPLGPPQPAFFNAAVRVRWDGDPARLLAATQAIEAELGRERGVRWGPRTLDIDLLHWSGGDVRVRGLEIPHPGLAERTFALAPLLDVEPELAPLYAERLAELGGPPPRAEPGWLAPEPLDDHTLATPWLDDLAELASLVPELIARIAAPSVSASHTLAFDVPAELFDARGACPLEERVREALASGFVVAGAAILALTGERMRGVLLGAVSSAPCAIPQLVLSAERRGLRTLRVRVGLRA